MKSAAGRRSRTASRRLRSSGAKATRLAGSSARKMPGQHGRGIAGGEDPGVALPLLGGELTDLGERDRGALGMEEQVVLGEEAGEEHAVPLLVGDLLDEQRSMPRAQTPPPSALARSRSAVRRPRSSGDRPAGDSASSTPRRARAARAADSARPRAATTAFSRSRRSSGARGGIGSAPPPRPAARFSASVGWRSLMRSEPSGFLPRSLSHLTLTLARRTPAVTNGRMLSRTPSSRSGSQPSGCSARVFQRT